MGTLNEKLVCPYCKAKQEYKAKDYFVPQAVVSYNIQCDSCDEFFNAESTPKGVYTFTNLVKRAPLDNSDQ